MGSFKLKLVVYFALLAIAPFAVAFYGFDTLARSSETRRVDAQLEAELRGSLSAYAVRLGAADQTAHLIAASHQLQRALRDGDRGAAAAIVRRHPDVAIVGRKFAVRGSRAGGATRSVTVIDGRTFLGKVVVGVPLDDRLLRAIRSGLDPRDELVAVRDGRIVAGPHRRSLLALLPGESGRVEVGGSDYRGLATAKLTEPAGVSLAALSPHAALDAAAAGSERRLLVGLLGALVLFAGGIYLIGRSIVGTVRRLVEAANGIAHGRLHERVEVRGRDEFAQLGGAFNHMAAQLEQRLVELEAERNRLRDATTRFGEALAATHDTVQLLRVVVETAVESTDAYGGIVIGPQGELARTGDPEAGLQRLELPLTAGKQSFGRMVLSGPAFTNDQRETAASLVSHAVVALENARLHSIVERQALADGLTGLANRRSLDETLRSELARADRFNGELCLVLADLDWFKGINDRYGHPCGDMVLREFARALQTTVREIDLAGRWGGEEFALILPGTDAVGGAAVAERARAALADRTITTPDGDRIPVTASFGVAAFPADADADTLVAAADDALYRAKREGKDRVCTAASAVSR